MRTLRLVGSWALSAFALLMLPPAALGTGPTFAGLWDMSTSQGGYFSVLMTELRPGFIAGNFENGIASQAGSWVGKISGNPSYGDRERLDLNLKQPGLGLVGKGFLTLSLGGDRFTGTISEAKPDGSGAVQTTVTGTRKGLAPVGPADGKPPKPMNP